MENYTILGGSGFIGSNLAQALDNPFCPSRADLYSIDDRNLGYVFYCLGDDSGAIEPNLGYLLWFLRNCSFESLVYLSSTRVYMDAQTGDEWSRVVLTPGDSGYLFNAMKLAAEAACLNDKRCKVARLSTVIGLNNADYIVPGLIRDAWRGEMKLHITPGSRRDFIRIEDVIEILPKITRGNHRIYNVASGNNMGIVELVNVIKLETGAEVTWNPIKKVRFPQISIDRIAHEFGFKPKSIIPAIRTLCRQYKDIYIDQILA